MTDLVRIAVLIQSAEDCAGTARCRSALEGQLRAGDRVVGLDDVDTVRLLAVDAVAVVSAGAVPAPHWLATLRRCFADTTVGAVTGPVLRFTDGRATNVLVGDHLGGALTGGGAWSDVPPLIHSTERVENLPAEQYAFRAALVGALPLRALSTVRGRAEILDACTTSGLATIRDSALQVEVHAPASSIVAIRAQFAADEGYLGMRRALRAGDRPLDRLRDIFRWVLLGSSRSPGLLPALPFLVSGGPRQRIARAASAARLNALRG